MLSSRNSRWLIIPMEIVERELNGNLLLAAEAVKQGWQCIIGTKRAVIDSVPHLPQGVAFLKSIVTSDIHNIRPFKKAGSRVVSLDVEGLVYTKIEEFVSCRFCQETIDETDALMFWGDVQRNAVAKAYPADAGKMSVTGTPIADLWIKPELHRLYDEPVAALKKRFGRYILIPSSFGTANHYMGFKAAMGIIERDKMIQSAEQKEFYEFWHVYEDHLLKIFRSFLALLPKLSAAFPDHKIIIRPHPSESHETWKEAAKNLPNIEVLFEGAVSPWLLGAEAILHYGCTTGLEGYLMGKPVVAYNISTEDEKAQFDHKLPHSISVMATTEEETIALLRHVMQHPDRIETDFPYIAQGRRELAEWIRQTDEGAAVQIMKVLNTLPLPEQNLRAVPPPPVRHREKLWTVIAALTGPQWIRKRLPERIRIGIESRAYGRHKTRTISEQEVMKTVQKLGAIKNVAGIRAEKIGENLFYVG